MKIKPNPLVRLRRMLNLKTEELAKRLGYGLSIYNQECAENQTLLMTEVTRKLRFYFSQPSNDPCGVELTGLKKELVAQMLLNTDVEKKYSHHQFGMKPLSETKIFISNLPVGSKKFTIVDMPDWMPISPSGNLLTHEFANLLQMDPATAKALCQIACTVQINADKVFGRMLDLNIHGYAFQHLSEAIRKEAGDRFNAKQLAAILLQIELVICKGILSRLRNLEAETARLQDEEKLHRRYKDWFVSQFGLDRKCYKEALVSGRLMLLDTRSIQDQKQLTEWPHPVYVRIALAFERESS